MDRNSFEPIAFWGTLYTLHWKMLVLGGSTMDNVALESKSGAQWINNY